MFDLIAHDSAALSLHERVFAERIRLVARRSFVAALSNPIGGLLLLFIAYVEQAADIRPFLLWFTLLAGAVTLSLSQTGPIVLDKTLPARPQHWLRHYLASKFILGCAWGAVVWLLSDEQPVVLQQATYVILGGVCSAVVIIHSLFWRGAVCFLLGILLPIELKILLPHSSLDSHIAIAGVIYFLMLVLYSAVMNRQLVAGVQSGIEATILAEQLSLANARAEQALSALQQEHRQLRQALATINKMADQDELTQLMNRRAIMKQLRRHQASLAAGDTSAPTLTMFDIDHFKNVNDRYGHDIGDQVLQQLAQRLSSALQSGEMLARLGGEEFVMLFTQSNRAACIERVEQLRSVLNATPLLAPPHDFPVTASFGLATLRTDETVGQWLKRADEAMYKAKGAGRNRLMINV